LKAREGHMETRECRQTADMSSRYLLTDIGHGLFTLDMIKATLIWRLHFSVCIVYVIFVIVV